MPDVTFRTVLVILGWLAVLAWPRPLVSGFESCSLYSAWTVSNARGLIAETPKTCALWLPD